MSKIRIERSVSQLRIEPTHSPQILLQVSTRSKYLGTFNDFASLPATGVAGDYADVDAGAGSDSVRYHWDASDAKWVTSQGVASTLNFITNEW